MSSKRALLLGTLLVLASLPLAAAQKKRPKPKAKATAAAEARPAVPQVDVRVYKEQIIQLTEEVAGLKARLADVDQRPESPASTQAGGSHAQEGLAAVERSRDLARQEAEDAKRELADLKASLGENQKSSEAILKEAREARKALEESQAETAALKKKLEEVQARMQAGAQEGALVPITPDVIPAQALNLARVTPKVRKVDPGSVVVNVLVTEKGEVQDVRLLQGLPGDTEWVKKAHEACLEAARRLVFDPARSADGKTRFKVWQGVAFHLD